jgi:site-specific recombinase XerD
MLAEIEQFVNWARRRSPDARTWKDYSYDLRQFAALVGDVPPAAITFREIDRFVDNQKTRGFQPTTINRRLATIISLYTFLGDEDPTLVCPVLPRRHHLREPQRLPRPVQEDHLRAFFIAIEETPPPKGEPDNRVRDRAMFLLMLRCGLRIAETAHLLLSDLYLEEPHPRLVARGKGSRERSVYLSHQAERALRLYLDQRPVVASEYVFLSYLADGLSTTAIHKRLLRYRNAAAVSLTAHRLRHSFANDLLNADVPVTTIQKLLGHRWLETTQVYVQANDKQVQADYYAACQKLEGWQ